MDEFETGLADAGIALEALAEGPGQAAADGLSRAFEAAGESIEAALSRAARSGELDFSRMAESVLADLARIAAEAVIARAGIGQASQTVNVTVGGGGNPETTIGARGAIARAVAQAAARGGRFV